MGTWPTWLGLIATCAGCSLIYDSGRAGSNDAGAIDAPASADAAVDVDAAPGETCTEGSDCGSGICDPLGGGCVDPEDAVYLAELGDDGNDCSVQAPCASFSRVQEARRDKLASWIAVQGEFIYDLGGSSVVFGIDDRDRPIFLYGEGAELYQSSKDFDIVSVYGADVTAIGLGLNGSGIDGTGIAARCASGGRMVLFDVSVTNSSHFGVHGSGDCEVEIIRSYISGSENAGVGSSEANLLLVSSVIEGCGGNGSSAGGVLIQDSDGAEGGNTTRIFHSTIVGNTSASDGDQAAGVRCQSIGARQTIVAAGNLVDNPDGANNVYDFTEGCVFVDSIVEGAMGPKTGLGDGVINTDVVLDSEFELLAPENDAVDVAALDTVLLSLPAAYGELDFDGTPRRVGDYPDMGAQERVSE